MLRVVLPAALVALLAACSAAPTRNTASAADTNAVRTVPGLPPIPGRVHSVNPGLKFAVIDYSLGGTPAEGDRLAAWRGGQKVAELRVSGQGRGGYLAADIVSGAVEPGDEVRP
ncbi:MAG: hypothetical protein ACKVYV_17775 [Limisphaerales bacterium]